MSKNLFELSEEEKNRIRGLHESYINKPGTKLIWEQRNQGDLYAPARKYEANELPDWKRKKKGTILFLSAEPLMLAKNVAKNRFYLSTLAAIGNFSSYTPGTFDIPSLDLKESSFPYPDNLVFPKFNNFPDAKKSFDNFVSNIKDFLERAGGKEKLPIFKVQGSADANRPNLKVPKGYTSLDHPDSQPYNGATDPTEMNQYLADKRAQGLVTEIVKAVLEKTNIDISDKFQVLKGINYYGQKGKVGYDFKKVSVLPTVTRVTLPIEPIDGLPENYETWRKINIDGVEYLGWQTKDHFNIPTKSVANLNETALPSWDGKSINGKKQLNGVINDKNQIYVDGIYFGTFAPAKSQSKSVIVTKDAFNRDFETEGKWVVVNESGPNLKLQLLKWTLSYQPVG